MDARAHYRTRRCVRGLQLEDWPETVKQLQRNWIGESRGMTMRFPLTTLDGRPVPGVPEVEVFTTRPDTLMGVTFVAVAPQHAAVQKVLDPELGLVSEHRRGVVDRFVELSRLLTTVRTAVCRSLVKLGPL